MPTARILCLVLFASTALADPPNTAYVFPAGGQRGTKVDVRVGGMNLHDTAKLHVYGEGVTADPVIERAETIWFEGPLIRQPASQRKENYPKDYRGRFHVAADAPGPVRWHVSNSQGVTYGRAFVVGDLPEIVEQEIDGEPIPVAVELPITINGRIFPREDIDVWTIDLDAGQTVTCDVHAARLGSPLDSRVEVRGPNGERVAENVDHHGNDSHLRFTAETSGTYAVHIHDITFSGLQDHVYRLTITAGPWVDAVYPLGGRRAEKTSFEVLGANLPAESTVVDVPAVAEKTFTWTPKINDQRANTVTLDLGDAPEHLEENEREFEIPATLNGRIRKPGETDGWSFTAAKGDKLVFEVRAAVLGSPLDSVLEVLDADGKSLGSNDDASKSTTDALLKFKVPADGTYTLRVAERLASRGGPRFAYRIHAKSEDTEPGFEVELPSDAYTVVRGVESKVEVVANRLGGYQGEIALEFDGLPEGVTVEGATIPAKRPKATITFTAADDVPVQLSEFSVTAIATIDEREARVPVTTRGPNGDRVSSYPLVVAIPTPFSFEADFETKYANMGCVHERRYRLLRDGYDGAIDVRLADVQARHLQGVTGPTIAVEPGATSFVYPVQLGPRMEVGRTSRSCVLAVARVKDFDGTEHDVCFGSTAQNEQFVLLTDPGRLHVAPERSAVLAQPNSTVELPIRIERGNGLAGHVTVEGRLADHVDGVGVKSLVIPSGTETGTLMVEFGETPGPFNVPLVLRARTTDERGHGILAESQVELVPAR